MIENKFQLTPEQQERVQWLVDALLSDRFLQGSGHLAYRYLKPLAERHSEDDASYGKMKHCCLGVACEVAIEHGLDVNRVAVKDPLSRMEILEYDAARDFLPDTVKRWYGFTSNNPRVEFTVVEDEHFIQRERVDLVALNDGDTSFTDEPLPFETIARFIRETYLENNTHDETGQADGGLASRVQDPTD